MPRNAVPGSLAAVNDSLLETDRLKGPNALLGLFRDGPGPELTIRGRLPSLTSVYESTNIPGLLFARTVALARNYRRAARPFIHCFRNRARALASILAMRDMERRRRTEPSRTP